MDNENQDSCCSPKKSQPEVSDSSQNSCCSPENSYELAADGPAACCGSRPNNRMAELLNRLWSAWLFVFSIPLVVLMLDSNQVSELLTIASSALAGTAPYIALAVLMIAYLKATGAEALVAKAFEGRENRMIVLAALFGGLAPFCSCEVIPFVAGLLAVGAPLSAVMAFWLSSPLIDPASLMITAGALGWEFAIAKAFAAIFLGLFGGFGVKFVLQTGAFTSPLKNESSSGCTTGACSTTAISQEQPRWKFWHENKRRNTFGNTALENSVFLLKWLSLAYLLEALLILYIPAELIGRIVGGEGVLPIVLGALVGMPAYLNSFAAPPLVAGLMEQGMSAGSAMAFMVAGAISSIPAMTAVWSLVKKQVFVAYLSFGVGGAIVFGILFSLIYSG